MQKMRNSTTIIVFVGAIVGTAVIAFLVGRNTSVAKFSRRNALYLLHDGSHEVAYVSLQFLTTQTARVLQM